MDVLVQQDQTPSLPTPLTLVVLQDVGGEAALVSHVGGVLAVLGLDDVLQVVVDLNAHKQLEEDIGQKRPC